MSDHNWSLLRPTAAWIVAICALALSAIGIAAIHTADLSAANPTGFAQRQMIWLALGIIVMLACAFPHPKRIGAVSWPFFGVCCFLLLILLMPFMPRWLVPVINGSRRWIDLQVLTIQPSEMARLAFILAVAWFLRHRGSHRNLHGLLLPFGIMFIPAILITLEPDLGGAILMPPVLFAMLIAAGAKLRHMAALLTIVIAVAASSIASIYVLPDSMQVLRGYQRARIDATIRQTFFDDQTYVQTTGFQQDRARTLVGAGGVSGYGAERSSVILRFNRLPENHNDMIYAVIVNRFGMVGGMAVLGLFVVMCFGWLYISAMSRDPFARLVCVGFAAQMFFQMTLNTGMSMGLVPIIGANLPFVSYGGSSLIISYCLIGLTLNFAARKPEIMARKSFEFEHPSEDIPKARGFKSLSSST
ncbi:MAG: rod shape-determining protein RodA [Phycisphaeraceae bacterium]|nr:rod shape-determining protein RodA [Phycisphaeraceae bacterium]